MAARGISPENNGTVDLGSTSKRWRKLYAQTADDGINMGNNYSLGYRKPNTSVSRGAVKYLASLGTTKKLVCVKSGTTGDGDLSLASTAEGSITNDGTAVWQVDSLANGIYNDAQQNSVFRGADITDYWDSGLLSENIAAGVFVGVYVGDFIKKTITLPAATYTDKSGTEITQAAETYEDAEFKVAGIDYKRNVGAELVHINHIFMLTPPLHPNGVANPTASTDGGFVGSDLFTVQRPLVESALTAAFGNDHIQARTEYYTNAVNAETPSAAGDATGASTGATSVSVKAGFLNEDMVYGAPHFSSSPFDNEGSPMQLPIYALKPSLIAGGRRAAWLSSVASSTQFCGIGFDGIPRKVNANSTSANATVGNHGYNILATFVLI